MEMFSFQFQNVVHYVVNKDSPSSSSSFLVSCHGTNRGSTIKHPLETIIIHNLIS